MKPLVRLLAVSLACAATAGAQPRLASTPVVPAYGEAVALELENAAWPTYLPATRYTKAGSAIDIEYEYVPDGFGPVNPAMPTVPLWLGELAPGNYQVRAWLRDIADPSTPPIGLAMQLAVAPPLAWGVYPLPMAPRAFSATHAIVRSAAYFDPATMRASVSGNAVRVEFDYSSTAPFSGPAPPRMSTFGTVRLPDLAPGPYRLEGWGRDGPLGEFEVFFTRDFVVAPTVPVVEFYSALLGHYFVAAGSDEIDLVDRGGQGDWKRTGQGFSAWLRQSDAPSGAAPVCRFYAAGPNSHFYTGSSQECGYLRGLETQQRAEASARGEPFLGWAYEAIAFWTVVPQAGQCPAGMVPVYRAYNDRALQRDSNHRFMVDAAQRDAMSFGWLDEGAHLCSPSG
jgi:hypothetical protein